MDYNEILSTVFTVIIIPLLGVLTTYLVVFIRNKTNELKVKVNNEQYDKYIDLATDALIKAVVETNQVYVNSLKKQGEFTLDAQKIAFSQTKQTALNIMDETAKEFLKESISDFDKWVETTIENIVVSLKTE